MNGQCRETIIENMHNIYNITKNNYSKRYIIYIFLNVSKNDEITKPSLREIIIILKLWVT